MVVSSIAGAAPGGLNWTAFELTTGQIILDTARITLNGNDLTTLIGQVSTVAVTLHLDANTPSPDWVFATEKGAAGWVAWTGSANSPTIVWGGIVQQRIRSLGNQVTLQLATPECYLDACPVSTYSATNVNQDTILTQLVTTFASGVNRLNWQLIPGTQASTVTQTVSYPAIPNVSVLGALQTLSATQTGGINGPEWFTSWQWNLAAGTILPTITYGQRVGHIAANQTPNVTLELTDLVDGSLFSEDYTAGKGANRVMALGSQTTGRSAATIPNAVATGTLGNRPIWTYIFTPNQQTSDGSVLAGYANRVLSALQNGMQPLAPVLPANAPGLTYGVDWFLGDDIGWYLYGGYQFPTPVAGIGRVSGVKINQTTVTPIIEGAVLS